MIKLFSVRKTIWFSALFLCILGCEKPKGEIDESVLPAGDILRFSSSVGSPFQWKTRKSDSLQTNNLSIALLGGYNDAETGTSTMATAFQLRLSSNAVSFGNRDTITVDSVLLRLAISDVYGREEYEHMFDVRTLSQTLSADSAFYSTQTAATDGENLLVNPGNTYRFSTEDLIIDGDTQTAQLRLLLNNSIGDYLIKQSTDNDYVSNENFLNFFKGLRVALAQDPMGNDGSVALINLLSIFSDLTVYYHGQALPDSALSYTYLINGNSQRVAEFKHDFSGSTVGPEIEGMGEAPYAYIKSAAGLLTELSIDNLDTLRQISPVGIASAEIFFPVKKDAFSENYPPNERLILVEINEDGSLGVLDDQLEGEDYFGGVYDEEKGGYTFRISRFVQQYTRRETEFKGLALISSFGGVRANRTVLLKQEEDGKRPELIVYFTQL